MVLVGECVEKSEDVERQREYIGGADIYVERSWWLIKWEDLLGGSEFVIGIMKD